MLKIGEKKELFLLTQSTKNDRSPNLNSWYQAKNIKKKVFANL